VVRLLLESRANTEITNNLNQTPLHVAAEWGRSDVLPFLLDAHADIDARNHVGKTPLCLAAGAGHLECVRLLLERHANVEHSDNDLHCTPLFLASQQGHTDIVELLLDAHANVHSATTDGRTPLWTAAFRGHLEIVRLLLRGKPNVNVQARGVSSGEEGTIFRDLIWYVWHGFVRLAYVYSDTWHQHESRYRDGWTPLMVAAARDYENVVELLLEAGADPNLRNASDKTALDLTSHQEIKKLLQARMSTTAGGQTPK